jgi:hypothetical protein
MQTVVDEFEGSSHAYLFTLQLEDGVESHHEKAQSLFLPCFMPPKAASAIVAMMAQTVRALQNGSSKRSFYAFTLTFHTASSQFADGHIHTAIIAKSCDESNRPPINKTRQATKT